MGLPASLFPFSASSFPQHGPGLVPGALLPAPSLGASGAVMPRCSWLGNGSSIAPALRAGRRLCHPDRHTAAPGLPCTLSPLPKAPHSPHTPAPHKHAFTPHLLHPEPRGHDPGIVRVMATGPRASCCPATLPFPPPPPQHGDGRRGSLPTLPFSFSPSSRLCSGAAPGWQQGTFPTCQRCWQQDLGSHLPSCSPAGPGPSAAGRQSPTRQSHNLPRRPRVRQSL